MATEGRIDLSRSSAAGVFRAETSVCHSIVLACQKFSSDPNCEITFERTSFIMLVLDDRLPLVRDTALAIVGTVKRTFASMICAKLIGFD
jgi:hypothetical protein